MQRTIPHMFATVNRHVEIYDLLKHSQKSHLFLNLNLKPVCILNKFQILAFYHFTVFMADSYYVTVSRRKILITLWFT